MSEAPDIARATAPELTGEHAYALAFASAVLQVIGPKKGRRLIEAMRDALAASVLRSEVIPIRGDRARHAREQQARIDAARRFELDLPALLRATWRD